MLVNALSVVKSCYFYMRFSSLIQMTKPVKEPKKKGEKAFYEKSEGSFSENYY